MFGRENMRRCLCKCVFIIIQDFDLLTMQSNRRNPLQRAVERRSSSFVHYFVKECNVDISSLDEVCTNSYVCMYVHTCVRR